mmetsp:Transcript_13302/g.49747  ORF Transcript_13302/g.49747 Transcript_13302/m.49747 type:complete len:200 (-) Transcript_13302:2432-3031(-)
MFETVSVWVNTALFWFPALPAATTVTSAGLHTCASIWCTPKPGAFTPRAVTDVADDAAAPGSLHATSAFQAVSPPTHADAPCARPNRRVPADAATTVSFSVDNLTACISSVPLPYETSSHTQNRNVVVFSTEVCETPPTFAGSFTNPAAVGAPVSSSASAPPIDAAEIRNTASSSMPPCVFCDSPWKNKPTKTVSLETG